MAASLSKPGFNRLTAATGAVILAFVLTTPVSAAPVGSSSDVQAAVDAYLNQVSPEERARGDAYFEGGYWLQLGDRSSGWSSPVCYLAAGCRGGCATVVNA
jgi:STE24 endopeptidase